MHGLQLCQSGPACGPPATKARTHVHPAEVSRRPPGHPPGPEHQPLAGRDPGPDHQPPAGGGGRGPQLTGTVEGEVAVPVSGQLLAATMTAPAGPGAATQAAAMTCAQAAAASHGAEQALDLRDQALAALDTGDLR